MVITNGWLTPEEVAERLKVHLNTVYRWLLSGRLKGVKAGDLWRINEQSLHEFLYLKTKDEDS